MFWFIHVSTWVEAWKYGSRHGQALMKRETDQDLVLNALTNRESCFDDQTSFRESSEHVKRDSDSSVCHSCLSVRRTTFLSFNSWWSMIESGKLWNLIFIVPTTRGNHLLETTTNWPISSQTDFTDLLRAQNSGFTTPGHDQNNFLFKPCLPWSWRSKLTISEAFAC